VDEEPLAVGREADAAGASDEQRQPGLGLQAADVPAERLLRDEEAARRPGEVQLLGDRDEGAEEAEVELGPHAGTLPRIDAPRASIRPKEGVD
jgi:hypothetical protein